MGGTRLLLVSAVLVLPVFSGCLDAAQEALGIDNEVEFEERVGFDEIELTYQVIPDAGCTDRYEDPVACAYQFQVPPGVTALYVEEGAAPETDEPSDPDSENQQDIPNPDAQGDDATESFALFTPSGDRIDPARHGSGGGEASSEPRGGQGLHGGADDEFRYRLSHPDAGAYVLVLYDRLDHAIQVSLEARPNEALDAAPFNAAILPLSLVVHRTLLVDREATAPEAVSGTIQLPFPPSALTFSASGAGTTFAGTVSSRAGIVYEERNDALFGGGLPFSGPGCCTMGSVERENVEGLAYDWEIVTDIVGKVYLTAWTHQPAPAIELPVSVDVAAQGGGWESGAGRRDILDERMEDEEHFFTGEASYGDGAYVFTVPDDAQALLLDAHSEGTCDPWYYPCSEPVTKVSLYDETGARLGIFALTESERVRIEGIGAGDYAVFVHSGSRAVNVGVVGQPPASARLHEQKLVTLALDEVGLTRTEPATVPLTVDGIPLRFALEVDCPSDRGFEFYALATNAQGVAFQHSEAGYGGFWFPCLQQTPIGTVNPEALVPGEYKLTVDSTGGVGTVVAKVLGLKSIGSGADDDEPEGGSGNETALVGLEDLESLIG